MFTGKKKKKLARIINIFSTKDETVIQTAALWF